MQIWEVVTWASGGRLAGTRGPPRTIQPLIVGAGVKMSLKRPGGRDGRGSFDADSGFVVFIADAGEN